MASHHENIVRSTRPQGSGSVGKSELVPERIVSRQAGGQSWFMMPHIISSREVHVANGLRKMSVNVVVRQLRHGCNGVKCQGPNNLACFVFPDQRFWPREMATTMCPHGRVNTTRSLLARHILGSRKHRHSCAHKSNHRRHWTASSTCVPCDRTGRNRLWPIRLWPSLSDRLWPIRLWPIRLWPTLRF